MTTTVLPTVPPAAGAGADGIPRRHSARGGDVVDIVVPVHNEAADLEASVRRLDAYLDAAFPFCARITIVDNASVDATWSIAQRLRRELPRVDALRLDRKGRGLALRTAWTASDCAVVAYMDVDLSTDLRALLPLVAPLLSGHSDVAIGSRLLPGSKVERGPRRELISRGYNLLLRALLSTRFHDAQCGFKAVRADVARRLLPRVRDDAWFFDTELLVLAERAGLRIHEVPVDWRDDADSRVDVVSTALADLRGVARVVRDLALGRALDGLDDLRRRTAVRPNTTGQALRFACIGVLSTAAYVVLYSLLRTGTGAPAANAAALLVTAVANTAANRRITFGVRGPARRLRDHASGLAAFGVALGITTGAVAVLQAVDPAAGRPLEVTVLCAANLTATAVRFVLLRAGIDRDRPAAGGRRHDRRDHSAPARLPVAVVAGAPTGDVTGIPR